MCAAPNVTFLPKPFQTHELVGITRKMLQARSIVQQVHKRHSTLQDAEVEAWGQRFVARVRNLSKGGAFLEFLTPASIKSGEPLKLKLDLKDLNRSYVLPAKIVWTHKSGNRGIGIGVEFTGQGEVQRSLIGI